MINVQLINNFSSHGNVKPTDVSSQRYDLFTKLIDGSLTSRLVEENPDYFIYFDTDLLATPQGKERPITELLKDKDCSNIILDITQDMYEDEQYSAVLTLCTVCVGFVTCHTPEMQEAIYEATGRLAFIVENPVIEESMKEADSNETKEILNPHIVWFGFPNEIFTVRQQQVENKRYEINTVILGLTASNRKMKSAFKLADIIYLPVTFNARGERDRVMKVQLCLMEGKFVVAPNLPVEYNELAFDGNLAQGIEHYRKFDISLWIKNKQETLLNNEGLAKSLKQFVKALELAPIDDFLTSIDCFLESEEINT